MKFMERPEYMSEEYFEAVRNTAAMLTHKTLRAPQDDGFRSLSYDQKCETHDVIIAAVLSCVGSTLLARFSTEFDAAATMEIGKAGFDAMFEEALARGTKLMAAKGKTVADARPKEPSATPGA